MKFKYINLNIWWGGQLYQPAITFLKQEKPDILVVQEAFNGQGANLPHEFKTVSELKKQLSFQYQAFAPSFLIKTDYGKIDCGNLICSKFPIKSTETIFYDFPYRERRSGLVLTSPTADQIEDFIKTPRNLQRATVTIDSRLIDVYNTQGIWGLDGKDNERRLKMSQTIVDEIKDKKNVILSGDFNVNAGTKSISILEKQLHSVFKDELKTSFNMKRKTDPGYGQAVVDMIFISPEIKVIDHYCPPVDISDHLPLVVVLELDEVY